MTNDYQDIPLPEGEDYACRNGTNRRQQTADPSTNEPCAALEREAEAVRSAGPAKHQLLRSARALAPLVASGKLGRVEVEDALGDAALTAGVPYPQINPTITEGLASKGKSPESDQPGQSQQQSDHQQEQAQQPQRSRKDLVRFADLRGMGNSVNYYWKLWILEGALALLSADGGTGKTRLVCDLIRRIRAGLPWPDGEPMTLPPDTPILWVPADNNYAELTELHDHFGLGVETYLNAYRDDPMAGSSLDRQEALAALEERIRLSGAKIIVVDTLGNATDADLCSQHETKRLAVPLQQIAVRNKVAIVLLYHNNKEGKPLGRRIVEKCRTVMILEKTAQGLVLRVDKSFDVIPPPLAVVMGNSGNEYSPADQGGGAGTNKPTEAVQRAMDWLSQHLADGTAVRVAKVRKESEAVGIDAKQLYEAKERLGVIQEGQKPKLTWRQTATA